MEIFGIAVIGIIIVGIGMAIHAEVTEKARRKLVTADMTHLNLTKNLLVDMTKNLLVDTKGLGAIAIDTVNKKVVIMRGVTDTEPLIISYRDVLSSEIIEDGETVTKTSRGSQIGGALIGGLALGGVGAIIGGLSGSTKSAEKISKLALLITINDIANPVHYVMFIHEESLSHKKSGTVYKNAMGQAQEWHGKIQVLIRQADEEDRRQEKDNLMKTVAITPPTSLADELTKIGTLRDSGVLTEKEFISQKEKLLK